MGEVRRQLIRGKRFDVHFDEADKGTTEIGMLSAAAIDDHADRRHDAAVRADDVDRFLDASAASDDVFGDDETFVRRNRKAASQDQAAGVFLGEDVALSRARGRLPVRRRFRPARAR